MPLKRLALCVASAAILASCTTSRQGDAGTEDLAKTARNIFGTELIGTVGATPKDQDKIDDTVAGACGAGSYKPEECKRHQVLTQQ